MVNLIRRKFEQLNLLTLFTVYIGSRMDYRMDCTAFKLQKVKFTDLMKVMSRVTWGWLLTSGY